MLASEPSNLSLVPIPKEHRLGSAETTVDAQGYRFIAGIAAHGQQGALFYSASCHITLTFPTRFGSCPCLGFRTAHTLVSQQGYAIVPLLCASPPPPSSPQPPKLLRENLEPREDKASVGLSPRSSPGPDADTRSSIGEVWPCPAFFLS